DAVEGALPQGSDRLAILFTIVTSLFIHGGWLHIVGNMLFLWIFGDNVEDRFGHLGYLAFYVLAGVAANVVQAAIDPNSLVPVVGASGAIAGVLGAYLVMFPTAIVHVLVPVFIFFVVPIPVPAVVMIGIWFLQNLLAGFATLGSAATPDAGVAWFAHIGGFLFGLAFAALFAPSPRRAPPSYVR
ncbi:MAG: rhomboid family intramembrane serine protease, partial [Dehalococcoidia bacterium]|nr:rhomboid family intramembrane serine protease [Dehalococcoidia bacterium]